jgi:hypothetical protein
MLKLAGLLVALLGLTALACSGSNGGGSSSDLLELPEGNFTEVEMRTLYRNMLSEPSVSIWLCPTYRGATDAEVLQAAKDGYASEDTANHIRPLDEVPDTSLTRVGIIIREECEAAQ